MLNRLSAASLYAMSSLALLAAATTTITVAPPTQTQISASQCSPGPIQCCDEVITASGGAGSLLLALLGIVLTNTNVLIGSDCSPISIIGIGGGSCSANIVCCENNSFGGLIAIGCIPVVF